MKKLLLITLATINLFSLSALAQTQKVIVQLSDAAQDSFWYPVTDSERFGDKGSTAFMGVDWEESTGSFFGELKINEGAGFASYRNVVDFNLADFKRLQFQGKGDGRRYKILLKDSNAVLSPAAYSYQASFKTTGKEQLVSLNLKNFKPVYRGKVDNSLPKLDLASVREIGVQINDGIAGAYKLEFYEWSVQK